MRELLGIGSAVLTPFLATLDLGLDFSSPIGLLSLIYATDGKRTPPIFFKPSEIINASMRYRVLRYKVLPWVKANCPSGNCVRQQDGTTPHTATSMQQFCKSSFCKFRPANHWTPSSPDLNPHDYFWWSAVQRRSNCTHDNSLASLQAAITEAWAAVPVDEIEMACEAFWSRVERVTAAEGSWIEHRVRMLSTIYRQNFKSMCAIIA